MDTDDDGRRLHMFAEMIPEAWSLMVESGVELRVSRGISTPPPLIWDLPPLVWDSLPYLADFTIYIEHLVFLLFLGVMSRRSCNLGALYSRADDRNDVHCVIVD